MNYSKPQSGYMLIAVMIIFFAAAVTWFMAQAGMIIAFNNKNFSKTQESINGIQARLVQFVSVNGRLPCPADPVLPVTNPLAGFPNADTDLSNPYANCNYPNGVVPWAALGLTASDVTDEWGRLISYRVYDGLYGFTQSGGASAIDCDTDNEGNPNAPPTANGLCDPNHDTLGNAFVTSTSPAFNKGLSVNSFSVTKANVAFVLISHGETGLGGYAVDGTRIPFSLNSADYPNTQVLAAPQSYIAAPASDRSIPAGAAGHFDDVLGYETLDRMLKLAAVDARPWPESSLPSFTPSTTANMTSPSLDPNAPHFMSSGAPGSGREFTTTVTPDQPAATAIQFGNAAGFYSGCLWWPGAIAMTNGASRTSLTAVVEFAAVDNPSDRFPGFTLGFLSGSSPAPSNTTCGTSFSWQTTTTAGTPGDKDVSVTNASGVFDNDEVFGVGIDPDSNVDGTPTGNDLTLDEDLLSDFVPGGAIYFGNSKLIERDLGWNGGSISAYNPNRFAVEFDAVSNTSAPDANDPAKPHLAVDYTGIFHGGTASSCAAVIGGSGLLSVLPCDSENADFSGVANKNASGVAGSTVITIEAPDTISGLVNGMPVSGTSIASGAKIASINGQQVALTIANTGAVSGTVGFNNLPAADFMQSGLNVFHLMRTEVYPRDCVATSGNGAGGASSISVGSSNLIKAGMNVYGNGVANGAKVSGLSGSTVSLTVPNADNVSGTITFGGDITPTATATGSSGSNTINVSDANGIALGMTVSGSGVATGANVVNVSGLVVTLSVANVGPVAGAVTFSPTSTTTSALVKAWTISQAGCNADPTLCNAFKNTAGKLLSDVTLNRQVLHAVACTPAPTVATAFDSLYFGITTANASKTSGTVTTPGTVTAGASTIDVLNASGIALGMNVTGTGIAQGATVVAISGTTISLSRANTATVTGLVNFSFGANVIFRNLRIQRAQIP